MARSIVARLRETLARLEVEQGQLADRIGHFKGVIEYFESLGAEADSAGRRETDLGNEACRELTEAGEPLHYREIYNRLRKRGVHVPGRDPARNVGAHLSNVPRAESAGKGMWGLKVWRKRPTPPAALTVIADGSASEPNRPESSSDEQPSPPARQLASG